MKNTGNAASKNISRAQRLTRISTSVSTSISTSVSRKPGGVPSSVPSSVPSPGRWSKPMESSRLRRPNGESPDNAPAPAPTPALAPALAHAPRESRIKTGHTDNVGEASKPDPSPVPSANASVVIRTRVTNKIYHRIKGIMEGKAADAASGIGNIAESMAFNAYMGIERNLAAKDSMDAQAIGYSMSGLRHMASHMAKGIKTAPEAALPSGHRISAPARGARTLAAKGKMLKTRVKTFANAANAATQDGIGKSLKRFSRKTASRAGKTASKAAVKVAKAVVKAVAKAFMKTIMMALGAFVSASLAIVPAGFAGGLVMVLFSGTFSFGQEAGQGAGQGAGDEPIDMNGYLNENIVPVREGFIGQVRSLYNDSLAENGGSYHFARLFLEGSEERDDEIPYQAIESMVYPADSLAIIMQPVFWAKAIENGLVLPPGEADFLLKEMWGFIAGHESWPLPLEYCRTDILSDEDAAPHDKCGSHHAIFGHADEKIPDCPNFTAGFHENIVEECDSETFYCPGHDELICGIPLYTEGHFLHNAINCFAFNYCADTSGCGSLERSFHCGGYEYCQGHEVLKITVRMDGFYELLDAYYLAPIENLAAISPRTKEQENDLNELKSNYELCLDLLAEVHDRYGFGIAGGSSADLSGVAWVSGTRSGNQQIIDIALSQNGQSGGRPYWQFMGFTSRVEWCACFVSWCFHMAGHSEPRFIACQRQGIPYFKDRGLWKDGNFTDLAPGDVIFFDWQGDGWSDHVGLVIGRDGTYVYTVEGNSGDMVRVKQYQLGSSVIVGYGLPDW